MLKEENDIVLPLLFPTLIAITQACKTTSKGGD